MSRWKPNGADAYFGRLNYTLANEDTALELALLDRGAAPDALGHVYTIAGSGGRALPLLAAGPRALTCVDIAQEQLYLTELRIGAVRALTHREFLDLWGYPPSCASASERRALFSRIALSEPARTFLRAAFEARGWESILYDGRWERTFAKLSRINRRLTGARGLALFDARTTEEQLRYLRERFPRRAWEAVVFLLGQGVVFNALLYKGSFPKKNIPGRVDRFYLDAFDRLFAQGPARRNFFLQILFYGRIVHPEGNPIECSSDVFARAKRALERCEVTYLLGDAVEESTHAARRFGLIDFFSFSDVPSYFRGERERSFLRDIRPNLARGAKVVVRNYLRVPEGTDTAGYVNVAESCRDVLAGEKVQMYVVDVFERADA